MASNHARFSELPDAHEFPGEAAREARELGYLVSDDFVETQRDAFPPRAWRVAIVRPALGEPIGAHMASAYVQSTPFTFAAKVVSLEGASTADWEGLRLERELDQNPDGLPASAVPNRLNWQDLTEVEALARRCFEAYGLPHLDAPACWCADGSWRWVSADYKPSEGEVLQSDAVDVPSASARASIAKLGYPSAPLEIAWEMLLALKDLRETGVSGDLDRSLEIGWRLGALTLERELRMVWPVLSQHSSRNAFRVPQKRGGAVTGAKRAAAADVWRTPALVIAKGCRARNRKAGQRVIAEAIANAVSGAPELDTIIKQIRKWERSGDLLRSAGNQTTEAGSS